MSQTWKITTAVVITALVVGSGVYYWQQNNLSFTDNNTELKTFSLNQDGGFSFQYPAGWKSESSATKITVTSPDWAQFEQGAEFLVWINPPGSDYEYLVKDLGSSNIYMDDVSATKNLLSDETGKINAVILKLDKENTSYFIKYEFVAENENDKTHYFAILDNIINTFKFNEIASATEAEKTFAGSGFSFTYPSKYIADDKGLWTEDGYKLHINNPPEACSTCHIPEIEARIATSNQTLDQYIIAYDNLPGKTLKEMSQQTGIPYEQMKIGDNDFIRIVGNDMFEVTNYYTKHNDKIVAFRVYWKEKDTEELKNIISTLRFK